MSELAELRKRAYELGSMIAFSEWGTHFVIANTHGHFYVNCRNLQKSTGGFKGQTNVGGWKLIKRLYANPNETYAVTMDGTLISTSEQYSSLERNPVNFKIAEIVKRDFHSGKLSQTVGLRTDGLAFVLHGLTLENGTHMLFHESTNLNDVLQSWGKLTVLKCLCNANDTYVGVSEDGQIHFHYTWQRYRKLEQIRDWKDLCDVSTMVWGDKDYEIIGLRKDGTLISTYPDAQWLQLENVVQIALFDDYGKHHVYALLADGKLYDCYFGNPMKLVCEDAVAVRSFEQVIAWIKKDGTVSVYPEERSFHNAGYRVFGSLETYAGELAATRETARNYLHELEQEKTQLESQLPKLQSIFKKKQREKVEQRLAEIAVLSCYDNPSYIENYYQGANNNQYYSIQQLSDGVLAKTRSIAGQNKKSSVVASAVAGAIIAGPVGAVVGAMHAIDKNANNK